ncbi:MAG: lysozyme inhibitor LprI family protein [Verrucomicrobiota bacterium]
MRTSITLLPAFLVAVFLASAPALAQNEPAPINPAEAKAAFDKADRALNEAWNAAKKALDESEFTKLKEDQRAWIEHRDYLARSPLYTGVSAQDELPLTAPEYLEAASHLANERAVWLRGLIRAQEGEEDLTGSWSDSYGGSIDIVQRGNQLHFVIQCVRGPTSHVGGLAGIATWNESIGWFSDKGRPDKGDEPETNLSFTLRNQKLEIIGAHTSYYHGARAYFDGTYVKTSKLDAKDQTKILKSAQEGEIPEE